MYLGWRFTLFVTLFCEQSFCIWPFKVFAAPDAQSQYDSQIKRIAIIGAGAAGSSTAWNLQKFAAKLGVSTNITVFERSGYVGGRSTTVNAYDNPLEPVELGASIFVKVNTILTNSSEEFGLKPLRADSRESNLLGIWNGETFVFTQDEGGWEWWSTVKILWKYGLAPVRTQRLMKSTVASFRKLYESPFFPFRSLSESAFDLGLTEITSMTGEQYLAANNIGPPFSTDIIQASTRVNYGQNLGLIHGLETMVCMAIEGAMQIAGGNWQIFDGMLKASKANVILNNTVTRISKKNGKYSVKTFFQNPNSGDIYTNEEPYDTIVLAAPLQFSDIEIEKDILKHTPDEIPYVTLHVTLFTSPFTLSPKFFNLAPNTPVPSTVLTTLPQNEVPPNPEDGVGPAGFFSISTLRSVINPKTLKDEYLYKVFSPRKLTSEFLSGILDSKVPSKLENINIDGDDTITWYYPHVWHSYPYEYPRVTFEDPELARGFYYTSGMESFISTMETCALMGMNVARLIVDDYKQELDGKVTGMENPTQMIVSKPEGDTYVEEL